MKIAALVILKMKPNDENPTNASDVSQFGFFQKSNVREFIVFVSRIVAKRTPPGQCQSVKHEAWAAVFAAEFLQQNAAEHGLLFRYSLCCSPLLKLVACALLNMQRLLLNEVGRVVVLEAFASWLRLETWNKDAKDASISHKCFLHECTNEP